MYQAKLSVQAYQEPVATPPAPPAPPYVYDDTATRIIRIRNDPRAASDLDAATAIDVALAHLGREVDDWELDDVEQSNDYTVIVQFTRL